MAWIESHEELGQHPKTKRLARALQVTLPAAVGHLQFLWWWALKYAPSGDLSKYTDEDIADAICWDGDPKAAMDALVHSAFIDVDEENGTRAIHDWYEYAGRLIEQREQNRTRAKRAREAHKREDGADVSAEYAYGTRTVREDGADVREPYRATIPNLTQPDLTQPDLTGQDTTTLPQASGDAEECPASGAAEAAVQRESVPYKKIMEAFNATCTRLAQIQSVEGQRQKAVAARFKTHGLEAFSVLFAKASASDFLCGGGAKNFTATFDWLMKPDNFNKVLEGNYDNRADPTPQQIRPPNNMRPASDPFANYARRAYDDAVRDDDA